MKGTVYEIICLLCGELYIVQSSEPLSEAG